MPHITDNSFDAITTNDYFRKYANQKEYNELYNKYLPLQKQGKVIIQPNRIEFTITDYCNLKCKRCSAQCNILKTNEKQIISLAKLQKYSKYVKPHEFHTVGIMGGEPTLHPEFAKICKQLPKLFPSKGYLLFTNGFNLTDYLKEIKVFNWISLSHYPGFNDKEIKEIKKLNLPNVFTESKTFETNTLMDLSKEPNKNKSNLYYNCDFRNVKSVRWNKIFHCCSACYVHYTRNVPYSLTTVPFNSHWRENLKQQESNMNTLCKKCFLNCSETHKWFYVAFLKKGKLGKIYPYRSELQ